MFNHYLSDVYVKHLSIPCNCKYTNLLSSVVNYVMPINICSIYTPNKINQMKLIRRFHCRMCCEGVLGHYATRRPSYLDPAHANKSQILASQNYYITLPYINNYSVLSARAEYQQRFINCTLTSVLKSH